MKKTILLFSLFLFGCGSPNNSRVEQITNIGGGQLKFYVVNENQLSPSDLQAYVDAQNIQLQRDFKPNYGIDCVMVNQSPPNDKELCLHFIPNFNQVGNSITINYFGLHRNNNAYVNGSNSIPQGFATVTASHEVLETLGNPNSDPNVREIVDSVQMNSYLINNLLFSNFVFRNYDMPGSAGPWDFMGLVTSPLTPTAGGENEP